MRITSAINGIERAFRWTEQELATTKTRGNYGTTIAAVDKMLEQARQIVENLEKIRNGESSGGANHGDKQDKQSDKDVTNPDTLSKVIAGTIDALNKMGFLHWNTPNSAQSDVPTVPADSHAEINPKLKTDVAPKSDVAAEPTKKERKDWKKIVKQYHIAIDGLKNYTFKHIGGKEFADYIKRWFDVVTSNFKNGVRLAADKIPRRLYDFAFVFGKYWGDGKMGEFDDMFCAWENGVKYHGMTYSAPAEIGSMPDELPDPYGHYDYGCDIMLEIIEGPMKSLTKAVCGNSREFLSSDAFNWRLMGSPTAA